LNDTVSLASGQSRATENPKCFRQPMLRIMSPSHWGQTTPCTPTCLVTFSLKIFRFTLVTPVVFASASLLTPFSSRDEGVRVGGGNPAFSRLANRPPPAPPAPLLYPDKRLLLWIRSGSPASDLR